MRSLVVIGRTAGSLAAVAFVTLAYWQIVHVNPTTVALSYLVVILAIATGWGIVEATTASVVAMLCFNFFFLPPTGTFTIADPQNWVALVAFLLTAITASQLSDARQRELDATARGHDLERPYALSRSLLLVEHGGTMRPRDCAAHSRRFSDCRWWPHDRRTSFRGAASWNASPEPELREVAMGRIAAARRSDCSASSWVVHRSSSALFGYRPQRHRAELIASWRQSAWNGPGPTKATARAESGRASSELRATVLDALAL